MSLTNKPHLLSTGKSKNQKALFTQPGSPKSPKLKSTKGEKPKKRANSKIY
jgi:hypothetical protein